MSDGDNNNPYAAPKADIASSPQLQGPGSPVKAVLIGALSCIAIQIVVGLVLFALGVTEMRDGREVIPPFVYALGVLLSIPINAWAGSRTARIANAREYQWAALAGLIVTGVLYFLNGVTERNPAGYEMVFDLVDHLLTVPAFLAGAWWKLRADRNQLQGSI